MKKRILAVTLAALILIGCLTGCGEDSAEQTNVNSQLEEHVASETKYAYQASYYPLDFGVEVNYLQTFCISGDSMILAVVYNTGNEIEAFDPYAQETYTYMESATGLFKIDLNTRTVTQLNYTPKEIPEGMEGNAYLESLTAGADGTFWACESCYTYSYDLPEDFEAGMDDPSQYYVPGEDMTEMCQYDLDGNLLQRIAFQVDEGVYLGSIYVDGQGYFYSTDWEQFYIFDGDGAVLATLPNESYGELMCLDDQVGVRYWTDDGATFFKLIDPETKAFGEEFAVTNRAYNLLPGTKDYQYLYNYSGTIYGHREDGEEDEKLFSFLDCDVNSNFVQQFSILDDGTVVCVEEDSANGWPADYNLIVMEQVDASTLPQKQELTLACMYLDWNLRTEIINFNRSSSDVRITVKDYSEYNTDDDYTAGLTKFKTEVLSGVVPDMLFVDSSLPMAQLAEKGVLMDLWPLIDSDPELSRDDLMTHFFDVLSDDGKLYQITDCFYIETAIGLTRVVGDRSSWTLDEMLETLAELEPGATIFGESDTRDYILTNCVCRSLEQFIDWSNPTAPCSFDSQEFIDMLKFANSFPEEFDWENYDWDNYVDENTRMLTGKQLLTRYYLYGFDDLKYTKNQFQGEDLTFVGYPSSNGNGSYFTYYGGLAIGASCKNTDAAWRFVRYLLTEEHQADNWGFATNRHVFEAQKEAAMQEDEESMYGVALAETAVAVEDDVAVEEPYDVIEPLTEEDCEKIMALYESCSTIYSSNDEVMEIIEQETEAFFNGQKTAEETARLIQDRVGLYVMEQG